MYFGTANRDRYKYYIHDVAPCRCVFSSHCIWPYTIQHQSNIPLRPPPAGVYPFPSPRLPCSSQWNGIPPESNLWNGAICSYMVYNLGTTALQLLGRRQFLALYLLGGAFSQSKNINSPVLCVYRRNKIGPTDCTALNDPPPGRRRPFLITCRC